MKMSNQTSKIPLRSEVAIENTWDLTDLYASDEDWKKDAELLKEKIVLSFVPKYIIKKYI